MDPVIVTTSSGLADAVRDVNAEVINLVEGCSDRQWARKTAEEGWTLSMAGMHIAMANLAIATLVHRTASALGITDILEGFEKSNALVLVITATWVSPPSWNGCKYMVPRWNALSGTSVSNS
jgi:hypothetical protein